jgi:hypothetical protein
VTPGDAWRIASKARGLCPLAPHQGHQSLDPFTKVPREWGRAWEPGEAGGWPYPAAIRSIPPM